MSAIPWVETDGMVKPVGMDRVELRWVLKGSDALDLAADLYDQATTQLPNTSWLLEISADRLMIRRLARAIEEAAWSSLDDQS